MDTTPRSVQTAFMNADIESVAHAEPAQAGLLRRLALVDTTIRRTTAGGLNPLSVRIDELRGPTEAIIEGRPTLLFGTNSYLGLNFHPECMRAATDAVQRFGTGSTASRVASGNHRAHEALEAQIAAFYGRPDAVVFSTGFMANLGVISALAREGDAILLDAHCHASIFDAAKLSGATIRTFRHNDAADLDRLFEATGIPVSRTLVVVEGLYSVWGDLADLPAIAAVTKRHGAVFLVDEAHALGVYGPHARGVAELQGVENQVDVIVGTFSKSVGVIGGFCVTNAPELRALRFMARSYLYTASLPPAIVSAASTALRLIQQDASLVERLWCNARALHEGLQRIGLELCAPAGPIGSVRMRDTRHGLAFWRTLLDRGIYVNIMVPPSTPEGQVVLRFSVSAAHTPAQIETALSVFRGTAQELAAA
jgi:8-amino-7-oxononanoate synthase